MSGPDPIIELAGVEKAYGGLRPLRVRALSVGAGQTVAILGLDPPAAEMFVHLVTGATLPDAGTIRVFGQATGEVSDSEAWLALLDRFGILTDRAVLLDQLTAAQNVGMTMTLAVEPMDAGTRATAVALGAEVGLDPAALDQPVAALDPLARARVRLARALALGPRLLVMEHPSASLDPPAALAFAADLARVIAARTLAAIALTGDPAFARALGGDVRAVVAATGELAGEGAWHRVRRLFGG